MRVQSHAVLCVTQGRRGRHPLLQHVRVEALHQLGGRLVVNLPQARHDARRARVHEAARKSHQTFAAHVIAERRAARAQHHQIYRGAQVIDVGQSDDAAHRAAVTVYERKQQVRKLRPPRVEQAVGGEVQDAVLPQIELSEVIARGVEAGID